MRQGLAIVATLCVLGLIGCSGKSASPVAESDPSDAGATVANHAGQPHPVAVPATAKPEEVVSVFLDAIRRGDSATTEALLTAKAREELEKHDFAVVPQATPNMQFDITGTQIVGQNDGAHVHCRWTERYEDGDESYDVVWVLRQHPEGWRVAGLAMQLVPEQPVQFLNFEDVADMEQKKADMEQKKNEAMSAMQPAAETAQQPGATPSGTGTTIER